MTRRAATAVALVVALTAAVGLAGCGEDERPGAGAGDPVEGRTPSTDATSGPTSTSAPGSSSTAPEDDPGPLADVAVTLTPVATAEAPVKVLARPGSDLLYVAEQAGRILTVDPTAGPGDHAGDEAGPDVVLDLTTVTRSGGEQGLLGLAFSPDGDTLYVHHSGLEGETRVASFAMTDDVADPASRVDLLTVDQPYPNHNGGEILVGPDGMLWIGLGDGGAGDDPDQRAQGPDDLLGKVLRIDPAGAAPGEPYAIPEGNLFTDGDGRPEIAVMGVRNPWRMRFDEATGDLWVADVGQNRREEVNRVPAGSIIGANLGWSRFEGSDEYLPAHPLGPGTIVGPVFEMDHADGWCSVSGGPVYRGEAVPGLVGAYLFGDFCKPGLSAIRVGDDGQVDTVVLDDAAGAVVSIDTGPDGEAYVVSLDGTISRIDPA